jgi:hypothetical protein
MWVMLILIGGLAFAHGPNIPDVLVSLFIIWGWIYNFTLGAGALVLSSKISDLSLRAYTQPLVTIANAGLGWVSNFVSPYLINPDEAISVLKWASSSAVWASSAGYRLCTESPKLGR